MPETSPPSKLFEYPLLDWREWLGRYIAAGGLSLVVIYGSPVGDTYQADSDTVIKQTVSLAAEHQAALNSDLPACADDQLPAIRLGALDLETDLTRARIPSRAGCKTEVTMSTRSAAITGFADPGELLSIRCYRPGAGIMTLRDGISGANLSMELGVQAAATIDQAGTVPKCISGS